MSENSISSIETGTFDDLISLIELDLRNNCLFQVHQSQFSRLKSLASLDLSPNLIRKFDPRTILRYQSKLRHLNLSSNLLEQFISHESEFLPNLEVLDLSYDELFKDLRISNSLLRLNLNQKKLTVLKNNQSSLKNLQYFYGSGLNHMTLEIMTTEYLKNFMKLDMSFNDLSQVSTQFNFKSLRMKRPWLQNSILNSNLSFLQNFVNLIELDLSSAMSIYWPNKTIFNLLTRLQVLKLANLGLDSEYLDKYIQISNMKFLIYLDLSQNRLEYLTSFPTNRNYLILSNNRIKSLSFYKPGVFKK